MGQNSVAETGIPIPVVSSSPVSALLALIVSGALNQAPPPLPPEPAPTVQPEDSQSDGQDSQSDGQDGQDGQGDPTPPTETTIRPPRQSLPAGLRPVPFPLEHQRRDASSTPISPPAHQQRRSIVDLRDPFDRPPPRPLTQSERDAAASRLLMPDLKDPFAVAVRLVRSKTLGRHVPNDIRDPFQHVERPDRPKPPVCVETRADGTLVQHPGKVRQGERCVRPAIDLRDPFERDPFERNPG